MKNIIEYSEDWRKKRLQILNRDNFTCQSCKTFNPSYQQLEIYREDDSTLELHYYESTPGSSVYQLASQKTGLTLELDFGTDWLVLPVLQAHHKRYIEGKKYWEYDDTDLVTLCKRCHTSGHADFEIPFYDSEGNKLYEKKIEPEDYSTGRDHNYDPWRFIRMDHARNYYVTDVKPTVKFFLLQSEMERYEEVSQDVAFMVEDFFARFLPNYRH